MKFLLDENLSWRLNKYFQKNEIESIHINQINFLNKPAKDIEIWNFASKFNYSIITNDDDFVDLSNLNGHPPKVIIFKTGNQTVQYLENLISIHLHVIKDFESQNEFGVLEIF